MARPPRLCWVYKPWHQYRNVPRPDNSVYKYDPEEWDASPENFEHKLDGPPPKLWVAWIYRYPRGFSRHTPEKERLRRLFGECLKWEVNKMKIFKNTPYWNQRLWECKQFIEIRPITFPHGEPTEGDVNYTTILSNGECVVDKNLKLDEGQLTVKAEDDLTSFPRGYVPSKLLSKWHGGKNIQEDDVWGMKNMSTF